MTFDPKRLRKGLHEYLIALAENASLDEARRGECIGSVGNHLLHIALQCILVGEFAIAKTVLAKVRRFLQEAIEKGEHDTPGLRFVLDNYSLTSWLVEGRDDKSSLRECVALREKWFQGKGNLNRTEMQLSLLPYLQSGQLDTLMARYESVGLTKPKSLRHIKGEGTMCYVLARHRLGLDYTDDEISQALQTFLKRCMEDWLFGHYCTVARWMKIAHWKPGDDPIATVLRCYDYLPGRKPPKYPPG